MHWLNGSQVTHLFFLQDKYLKYLGWCLYDKDVDTRKAALDGIIELYQDPSHFEPLEMFTMRFLPRIMEMIKDVDRHVATSAVQLMTTLLKAGVLSEKHGEDIPYLVWDSDAQLSKAAAAFSYQDIFAVSEAEEITEERQKQINQEDIVELLKFFREYCPDSKLPMSDNLGALQSSTATLVEAFWDYLPCLKDWSILVSTLLSTEQARKSTSSSAAAEDRGQAVLANILLSSAKKLVSLAAAAKMKISAQSKAVQEELKSFSTFFASKLAELLTVFQADAVKVYPVVQVATLFPSEFFTTSRQIKLLKDLLGVLRCILFKHSHLQILDAVSTSLSHLCKDPSVGTEATQVVREIASELLDAFNEINQREESKLSDDDRVSLLTCLKRIRSLYSQIHVEELAFSSDFNQLLATQLQNDGDEEVVSHLLVLHHLDLLWSASSLPESPDVGTLDTLSSQQTSFLNHLEDSLKVGSSTLKDHAFHLVADVLSMHSAERLDGSSLKALIIRPLPSLRTLLCNHFEALMNGSDDDDNESEKRRLEVVISACKIISSGPSQHSALRNLLVACFTKHGEEVDKVIKLLLNRLKKMSLQLILEAQLGGLKQIFSASPDRLHDVATKFVVMHNLDPSKRSFLPLLREGISFALQDENYRFLEALIPFVGRCSIEDAQAAFAHLEAGSRVPRQRIGKAAQVALNEFRDMLDRKRAGKAATPAKGRKRERGGTPAGSASPATSPFPTPSRSTPKATPRAGVRRALKLTVSSDARGAQDMDAEDAEDALDHKHVDEVGDSKSVQSEEPPQVNDEEQDIFESDQPTVESQFKSSRATSSVKSKSSRSPKSPKQRTKATPSFPASKPKRRRRFN